LNGKVYEAFRARREHRCRCELYHSALEVATDTGVYVIEMAPAWDELATDRGVVGEGAVGSRLLGHLRLFQYEIRCWRDGRIPDVEEAVNSPQRLTDEAPQARRVLDLIATVPTPVWGRDELRTGDMWNSNSVIAWLLVTSGIDPRLAHLPPGRPCARVECRSRCRPAQPPRDFPRLTLRATTDAALRALGQARNDGRQR
jgi:hypothetical protein